jgi:ATP-dependent DNA helicase
MGLGKTIQTIAFLAFLRSKGTFGPFLVAAPLSTLSNWINEIQTYRSPFRERCQFRFTPDIPCLLYHGDKFTRESIREKYFSKNQHDATFPIVVTSYEIIMHDRQYLSRIQWKFIIIDEGHRIKNLNCKLVQELKSYDSANRLLLTGTPLQNNLKELWSLLNFIVSLSLARAKLTNDSYPRYSTMPTNSSAGSIFRH